MLQLKHVVYLLSIWTHISASPLNLVRPAIVSKSVVLSMAGQTWPDQQGFASSLLEKRQPHSVQSGLEAAIAFHCPIGGTFVREFQWEAIYVFGDKKLGIQSLDDITDLKWSKEPDFRPYIHHSFCAHNEEYVCNYVFRALTFGSYNSQFMMLSLLTAGNIREENPLWTEQCVETAGLPPGTCPAMLNQPSINVCHITMLDVNVIH